MKLSRREALIATGASGLLLTGCGRVVNVMRNLEAVKRTPPQLGDDPYVTLLSRFAFGPSQADVTDLRTKGVNPWLEHQLKPTGDEQLELAMMVERLETEHLSAWELRDYHREAVLGQMRQKAILMATYSPWQLRERMVDFWSNHFSIFADKGLAVYRKPMDERNVVRKNALGSFPDMLKASAESTAMLVYLDQQASNASHPNENYGRELLELHTLGVNGGYTQKDVMEVARCFTGWTEERGFMQGKGKFKFDDGLHDDRAKTVLGHQIPAGGGIKDGYQVLDIVSLHPATARHLAAKMVHYFMGDNHPDVESKVAAEYTRTQGDISSMIRVIYGATLNIKSNARVKRPFDFVVGSMRALDANTDGAGAVQNHLTQMGQGLYTWPMPDGYPIRDDAWTTSILGRWRFAVALCGGQVDGTSVDLKTGHPVEIAAHLPASALPRLSALVTGLPQEQAVALVLSSPEYQWT